MSTKPIHAKPALYSLIYFELKEIAIKYGYNLVLHGSLNRDLDLIVIPWANNITKTELELIQEFDVYLRGKCFETKEDYLFSELPCSRNNYVINFNRGDKRGEWNQFDEQYYLDISFTPLIVK